MRDAVALLKRLAQGGAALAIAGFVAGHAAAGARAEPPGVSFLDPDPIEVSLAGGASDSIEVDVVSGSPVRVHLVLSVQLSLEVATGSPTGSPPPSLYEAASIDLDPGAVWAAHVPVSLPNPAPDSVEGTLLVTSSDGSFATRSLTLDRKLAQASFSALPQPSLPYLALPLPELTLSAERPFPFLAAVAHTRIDPSAVSKLDASSLISRTGALADVSIDSNGLLTVTATEPGSYKGHLAAREPRAADAPATLADVSLDVHDGIALPLLALLAGLAVGFLIEWLQSDRLPRLDLERRIGDLKEQASSAKNAHTKWIAGQGSDWFGSDGNAPSISRTSTSPNPLILDQLARDAIDDFTATPSAEARSSRWGRNGTEYAKLEDLAKAYEQWLGDRQSLDLEANTVRRALPQPLRADFDSSGMKAEVARILAGVDVVSLLELTDCTSKTRDLLKTVRAANGIAAVLSGIGNVPKEEVATYDAIWRRLALLLPADTDELTELATDTFDLRKRVHEMPSGPDHFSVAEFVARVSSGQKWDPRQDRQGLPIPEEISVATPLRPIERTPEQLRRAYYRGNFVFALAAALSVVAVGLSAQWATNATFGSFADYLTLFAWGAAGTAVAQFIRQLTVTGSVLARFH